MKLLQVKNLFKLDWVLLLLVSVLLMFSFAAIYRLHISFFESISKPVYIVSILLLVLVLFFGDSIRGTTGWFRFGGLSFQPAELAKFGLIIMLGYLIVKQGRRFDKLQFVVLSE